MSGDDGNFGVTRPMEPLTLGQPTRGVQTEPSQDPGERAIVHHFGCMRRTPLRRALVPGAIAYLCDECKARVSIGADGRPVAEPGADTRSDTPPRELVTPAKNDLPGGLTWTGIEATYRMLASEPPRQGFRRLRPNVPSRPETAKALRTSAATLKRACEKAGRGSRWPPDGF